MQSKRKTPIPELIPPAEMPTHFMDVWAWFLDLHKTRPAGMGLSSISYSEMQSYFNLLRIEPEVWEVQVIRAFDDAAMEELHRQEEKRTKKNNNKKK